MFPRGSWRRKRRHATPNRVLRRSLQREIHLGAAEVQPEEGSGVSGQDIVVEFYSKILTPDH